jgi:formamidopyrimidine-DNA glycosylase
VPEGPEVETIRYGLDSALRGQRVRDLVIVFRACVKATDSEVRNNLIGARVTRVGRHGKVLVLDLDSGFSLMVHLKMTGQMVLVRRDGERFAGGHPTESMKDALPDRSTRAIFEFESGDRLFFNDQRKFGWLKLVKSDEVEQDSLVGGMGPEALSDGFTSNYLAIQLARHAKAPVKAVILDQKVVAGIGNIYADESLNLAKIHPARRAGELTKGETKRLAAAIHEIIQEANKHGGTSFSHYVNSFGGKGDYLDHARVFRRTGEPCRACGTAIVKLRVAGRGTHICPKCQKLKGVV